MINPYRKSARELGPTAIELLMEWLKENFYKLLIPLGIICFACLMFFKVRDCNNAETAKEQQLQLEQKVHLQEMKKLCAPDHFQVEQKIGDDLWQISCIADSGKGRLVYQER